MSETAMGILTIAGFIGMGLAGASVVTFFNRRQKVTERRAKVIKKEIFNPGITTNAGLPPCLIYFSLNEGKFNKRVKYRVSEKVYSQVPENASGVLKYQGSELISFYGDGFAIEF